jgi:hypothetical protein
MFPEYKKHAYKVRFKTDDVFWLGGSQRERLQYHILTQKFDLVEVDGQDKQDLEQLAANHANYNIQKWYTHMKRKDGHEQLITFGAALEVQAAQGTKTIKGVFCYDSDITDEKAEYKCSPMSWEQWSMEIKHHVDIARYVFVRLKSAETESRKRKTEKQIRQAVISMYYQPPMRLTLPKAEQEKITKWIRDYFKDSTAEFPYNGNINSAEINFTIDFENDIEIAENIMLKDNFAEYNREHNKEHNIKHNKDLGRKKVEQTFSRLTGDEWSRQEILAQGFNDNNIKRFVDYGMIKRIRQGYYKRIIWL